MTQNQPTIRDLIERQLSIVRQDFDATDLYGNPDYESVLLALKVCVDELEESANDTDTHYGSRAAAKALQSALSILKGDKP